MKEKLKVPKLRFKEFSGEWEEKKLKNITSRIMDGTHFSPKSSDGDFLYITSKNIRFGRLDLTNISYISEDEHNLIYKRCPVKKGQILFTKDGANTGNACINTLDFPFSLLSSVAVIDGEKEILINNYLLQWILSEKCQSYIVSAMSGQAISRLTLEKINNFYVPITSLPEQQKIADFLSLVDEKIEKLTKKKELLEQYKKGVMQKIFSQEIRFKDDNGNDFPEWEEKEIFDIVNEYNEKTVENNQYPILSSSMNGIFLQSDYFLKQTASADTTGYKIVPKGYFTYRSMSDTGYFTFNIQNIVDKGIVSPAYPVFFVKEDVLSDFLYFQLNNDKLLINEILSLKEGGTRYALGFNKFKNLNIFLPSLPEQQKITDFLSALDKKIDIVDKELGQVQEFKKGLLQQMFV